MRKMPLNQIAFGKTDAFNELNTFGQEYFMESFVANPKYHIDDFLSGSRFFVCGKKGTGKSALLKYLECHFLKDESNLVFPIRFKSEIEQVDKDSFEEIASAPDNSTKNEKYDTSSILDQSSYVLVWKTFLINQIITRASAGEYRVFNETSTDYKLIVSLLKCIYSQQDRANIEKTFDELMDLVQNMDQEERRYVREGFSSDEELSLYDMLFSENLSKQDIQKIKKVAVDLLQKVKSKIAELDHWTDKQETKATIDTLIRDTLWLELPECYDELRISEYRQRIYEYVYTRYKGVA